MVEMVPEKEHAVREVDHTANANILVSAVGNKSKTLHLPSVKQPHFVPIVNRVPDPSKVPSSTHSSREDKKRKQSVLDVDQVTNVVPLSLDSQRHVTLCEKLNNLSDFDNDCLPSLGTFNTLSDEAIGVRSVFSGDVFFICGFDGKLMDYLVQVILAGSGVRHHVLTGSVTKILVGQYVDMRYC